MISTPEELHAKLDQKARNYFTFRTLRTRIILVGNLWGHIPHPRNFNTGALMKGMIYEVLVVASVIALFLLFFRQV